MHCTSTEKCVEVVKQPYVFLPISKYYHKYNFEYQSSIDVVQKTFKWYTKCFLNCYILQYILCALNEVLFCVKVNVFVSPQACIPRPMHNADVIFACIMQT